MPPFRKQGILVATHNSCIHTAYSSHASAPGCPYIFQIGEPSSSSSPSCFKDAAMAAVQQTRTRSARLIASITKSAQHANANAGPTQTASQAPAHGPAHGPSALSMFLTNLRLLDLDLRPDWPGIRPETFVTGGSSAQGQKKRVQCVEWALYQLFALWDPEETRKVSCIP